MCTIVLLLLLFSSFTSKIAADECTEGEVRLAGQDKSSTTEGRVEICLNGEWGTVCGWKWGASDSQVVCRQLGLVNSTTYADALYQYGGGSGPIHSGFQCTGNETHLVNCSFDDKVARYCPHSQDVGVRCLSAPCTENKVRLNGIVVQLCHEKQWGLVCSHEESWTQRDVGIVCNEVGFPSTRPRALQIDIYYFDGPVILNDIACTGSEESFIECSQEGYANFTECRDIAIAQCEMHEVCGDTDTIRLTQFLTDTIGRLEVCSGGRWGSVCGNGVADDFIAVVACRQLNHAASGSLYEERDYWYLLHIVPITRTNMVCTGTEDAIQECSFEGDDIDSPCTHANDVIISCVSRECNETDIKLVNGQSFNDGRVEVCLHGLWGSVCDSKWDTRDAKVVCRQLQYNGPSYPLLTHDRSASSHFLLDGVQCLGNESRLSECDNTVIGIQGCTHNAGAAGVICTNVTCEDGTVHLVGADAVSRGRVEYCYQSRWYSVCASDWAWDGEEARVICKTLGYNTAYYESVVYNFGRGTSPILPMSIQCTIDDIIFSSCTITYQDMSECQDIAGVICKAPCATSGFTDCSVCGSRKGCHAGQDCNCYSNCYDFGDCCPDVSHVEHCITEECRNGEVRLVGGPSNSTGRLELCANGVWGRICNRFQYWGPDNTRVVCRQLGFPDTGAFVVNESRPFGRSERTAVLSEVHCVGTETELLECSHSSIGWHTCGLQHQELVSDITISCHDEYTCKDGDVRLQAGTDPTNGRVEICKYRTWGAICTNQWDDADARVVCRQRGYDPQNARTVKGFGKDENTLVFLDKVTCTGSEMYLNMCMSAVPTRTCKIAGVSCGKSSYVGRCADEAGKPPDFQNIIVDKERFGVCEAYKNSADVCLEILELGVDFVYISNSRGSQGNITNFLNQRFQSFDNLLASHDEQCVEQVLRVLCHYFLPPCGKITNTIPPFSLCQEECAYVQSTCRATWQAATLAFNTEQIINCSDTSNLLLPLPNCCTGAGIELPTSSTYEPPLTGRADDGAIAGTVVGTLILMVAAVVAVVGAARLGIMYKKVNKKRQMERIELDILAVPTYNQPNENRMEEEASGSAKDVDLIADPNIYRAPCQATAAKFGSVQAYESRVRVHSTHLRELTHGKFIIKYENITLLDNIGEREFGIVYKARVGQQMQVVAVKTLKGDFDQFAVDTFVEESLKMSRFKHSHVMGLIGVCINAGSAPFIIMPYMANGSLLKYLKRERRNIVLTEENDEDEVQMVRKRLTVMCSQIASGMEYLAEEKYIHRDLAARNCMIDAHFQIRISDFGLSEDVFVKNYFRQGSAGEEVKLPVKWMAPESLSDGHFSEKSDVWSFGVTMWEIFSGGKAPFPGTSPLTHMQKLEEGERLPKPYNTACTNEMYAVMNNCWELAAGDRPTFKEVNKEITKYIEHMVGYLEISFNPFAGEKQELEKSKEEGRGDSEAAM